MGHLGQMPPPPLVEEPLLIKYKLYARTRSAYKTQENMQILLVFITNSPETKANQNQTNYEIVIQHLRAY